ncbi:type II secretion system protein [Caballeronia zhejiangensis]|uniref:type II secretion system protein n=1 Tax=Caballeronia zhejiangensis TaxID=871203 RepID=UPI001FCFFD3D|nr:type II secretion system protein [Caballeronia zhejiangensis]
MAAITARGERRGGARRKRERGFGMLWALMCVALISICLMAVGTVWTTQIQRVKEDELLRRGDAIRRAIEAYVKADKSGAFPKRFDDLLRDPRASYVQRYLREAYADPMTNDGPWQEIRGPDGELYGVYSASNEAPLKKDGFSDSDASFGLQTSISEWKFTYYPEKNMSRR